MKHTINPLNLDYKYQFYNSLKRSDNTFPIYKETADPSAVYFKGTTYIFSSMCLGVYYSKDLINWTWHDLSKILPCYDYAPDVKVHGEYVYFTASRHHENCSIYRTKDVINGPYEEFKTSYHYWDPCLLFDDDNRVYLFQGSSNVFPIDGVELDPVTFEMIGKPIPLIYGDVTTKGFERFGEDHKKTHCFWDPFIEGAWVNKYNEKYYLQYGMPGTEINVYGDGVYVSDKPLGPYTLQKSNPYSYAPGSFMPGAGHGSTWNIEGKYYHASTMRISVNNNCERRIGIWKAGFDKDDELYCDQNYNDWPQDLNKPMFSDPDYYLLSYKKKVITSSENPKYPCSNLVDENCQTFYQALSNNNEYVIIDLEKESIVNFIQINYGDVESYHKLPNNKEIYLNRYIDEVPYPYKWTIEYSVDGVNYIKLAEQLDDNIYQSHPYIEIEEGLKARYIKLTTLLTPRGDKITLSGLRVFGHSEGTKPIINNVKIKRTSPLDFNVEITADDAIGYNIVWGYKEDKLYHSYLTYKTSQDIGALTKDQDVYVRVDAFNTSGITKGKIIRVESWSDND